VDRISSAQRSRNMAAVRSRDTRPELEVRRLLHSLGLRFRLHQRTLPGTPDIVLKKHNAVVLVHGCFWHSHHCGRGKPPSSRTEFWLPKLERNRLRDKERVKQLKALGWHVLIVWECELKDTKRLRRRLSKWFGLTGTGK
jgi:DNA mismatch endonuclease (patch repair protein)